MLADTSACNYLCCWNVVSTFTGGLLVPFVPEVGLVILRTSLETVLMVFLYTCLHIPSGVLDASCMHQGFLHCHLNGSGLHILLFHVDC